MSKIDKLIFGLENLLSQLKTGKEKKLETYDLNIPEELVDLVNKLRHQALLDLPQISLKSTNIKGATLLPNRMELLKKLPKNGIVAELGVDNGDFSDKILELTTPNKLYLVDIWNTERYNNIKALNVAQRYVSQIEANQIEIKRCLSVEAANLFDDSFFDWVYIDTDHSYKTTLEELYAYAPKVIKDGYIVGHDYVMGNWVNSYKYGVIEAVAEFCVKENWRITYLTADFTENNSFAIQRI